MRFKGQNRSGVLWTCAMHNTITVAEARRVRKKAAREEGGGVTGEEGNVVSLRTMVRTVTLSDMGSH